MTFPPLSHSSLQPLETSNVGAEAGAKQEVVWKTASGKDEFGPRIPR